MVASVAAGILSEGSNNPMHGVAFDSTVLFTAIQLAEPDENYDPIDLGDETSEEVMRTSQGLIISLANYLKSIMLKMLIL